MTDIQLSSSINAQLDAIQRIQALQDQATQTLATQRRQDDATRSAKKADIVAQLLTKQASDLLARKDAIGQGIIKTQVAQSGLETIGKSLDQLKAIALQYRDTSDPTQQAKLQAQFDSLSQQVDNFARDSSYGGSQLISSNASDLTIQVSDGSSITIPGQASDSASLGLDITDVSSIDQAQQQVRDAQQSIGSDSAVLDIREQFSTDLVNQLQDGAAKLTEADLNEAAAQALAAQTSSQLSFTAIGLAANSEQSILQLF